MTARGSAVTAWSALGLLAACARLFVGCSGGSPATIPPSSQADGASSGSPGAGDDGAVVSMEDASVAEDSAGGQRLLDGAGAYESGLFDAGQLLTKVDASGGIDASGGVDAKQDSSAGDGGHPKDGSIDAPAHTGDGSAPTWCAALNPRPLFCADFDEGAIDPGWTSVHMTGGSIVLDTTEFQSAPGALIAVSDVLASTRAMVDLAAYRSFAITGRATFAGTLDLDFRVDRADAPGGVAVLAQFGLADGGGGASYFLQLVAVSNGSRPLSIGVSEVAFPGSGPVNHPVMQTIPLATWTHATLSLTAPFGGGAATAVLGLDGMLAEKIAVNVPLQNRTQTIAVGLTYTSAPSTGWTAVFDNVTFDAMSN